MTVIGTKSRGSVNKGWEMSPVRNDCTKKWSRIKVRHLAMIEKGNND